MSDEKQRYCMNGGCLYCAQIKADARDLQRTNQQGYLELRGLPADPELEGK